MPIRMCSVAPPPLLKILVPALGISLVHMPKHTFFKSRKTITNSVVESEGARIVVLPLINHLVSEFLLHQVVLDASVPVCVLR